MAFESAKIARLAAPGRFLDIRINNSCRPLLRRPFGVHRVRKDVVEILYEVVGTGTELLSRRKPEGYLDVIGPLGNGFTFGTENGERRTEYLVAGGMGVAPLLFLAEELAKLKTRNEKRKTQVLIGAKTKKQILCEKEFKDLGCNVKIATDDGSRGFKGKVTELLEESLVENVSATESCGSEDIIYACGPRPMLRAISRISQARRIPAQISLEEHLACGIGACLGCAVKTRDGYARICKEGPVFEAARISWGEKGE